MTKMPPDLQCIRDCEGKYDKTKHMSQDEAYFNGFDACYEAMSKTHVPLMSHPVQFASFKVTHVPVADVQILLDALEYASRQYTDGVYDLPEQAREALAEYHRLQGKNK